MKKIDFTEDFEEFIFNFFMADYDNCKFNSHYLAEMLNNHVQQKLYPEQTEKDKIIQAVCEVCRVDYKQLKELNRFQDVREARQLLSYLLRDKLNLTFQEIGWIFNQHHATVIHSYKKINEFKEYDKRTIELLTQIENKLI